MKRPGTAIPYQKHRPLVPPQGAFVHRYRMTGILLIVLGPALLGLAFVPVFAVHNQRPSVATLFLPSPSPAPSPTSLPTPRRVCTHIDDGHLHVRQGPGPDQPVMAWLAEGALVWPTGRIVAAPGGAWQEIERPVSGWVNAHYLCGGDHDRGSTR